MSAVAPGDELIGLARGFFSAGAPSLLVSLWTVDDESTAALMTSFYTRLRAGDRPAAALRHAQCELLRDHPHPFFWSPFVLLGRWWSAPPRSAGGRTISCGPTTSDEGRRALPSNAALYPAGCLSRERTYATPHQSPGLPALRRHCHRRHDLTAPSPPPRVPHTSAPVRVPNPHSALRPCRTSFAPLLSSRTRSCSNQSGSVPSTSSIDPRTLFLRISVIARIRNTRIFTLRFLRLSASICSNSLHIPWPGGRQLRGFSKGSEYAVGS